MHIHMLGVQISLGLLFILAVGSLIEALSPSPWLGVKFPESLLLLVSAVGNGTFFVAAFWQLCIED